MRKYEVVVTEHLMLIDFLKDSNLLADNCEMFEYLTDSDVGKIAGKNVIGVLPLKYIKYCKVFTEARLKLPIRLMGKKLTLNDVRQYCGGLRSYQVIEI